MELLTSFEHLSNVKNIIYQVLNLFLALLLNAFASESLRGDKGDKEDNKMKQGWRKLKSIFKKKKNVSLVYCDILCRPEWTHDVVNI